MTAIVDYGVGNLSSLVSSLRYIGENPIVTASCEDIYNADRVILPGVGAFGDAAQRLNDTGLVPVLHTLAERGTPLLGICLGMQLLFEQSFEYGIHRGLGLIPGNVRPIAELPGFNEKVPHMGWNRLHILRRTPLTEGLVEGAYVYYVHSFSARNCAESTDAISEYGGEIVGIVSRGSVCGTQFHPEKSGDVGLGILRRFCEMRGGA